MAGLAHQFGEAGAQRVPGVALGVDAGIERGLLDQAGDRLVGQGVTGHPLRCAGARARR